MRIGILLSGCGHYDGTDASEAVLTLLALEAAREKPVLLAPEVPQERIVDHLTGDEVEGAARDVLRESARLARGAVRSLSQVRPEDLEALIIPGGYGPVVNFSPGFARPGRSRALLPDVAAFIRHFVDGGKPVGTISLGEIPLRTVLGEEIDLAPPPADPRSLSVDTLRRLVHTPGFSAFTRLADVKAGIEAMVERLLLFLEETSGQAAGARPSPGEA